MEKYISQKAGIDFSLLYTQYLKTIKIPVVQWKISDGKISARLSNVVEGLTMKLWIPVSETGREMKNVSASGWTSLPATLNELQADLLWDKNYYVEYRAVNP